jgi:hypothetical protein
MRHITTKTLPVRRLAGRDKILAPFAVVLRTLKTIKAGFSRCLAAGSLVGSQNDPGTFSLHLCLFSK